MNNSVEFILRLKDLMSGAMSKATSSAQRDLETTARSVRALQGRIGDTRSIATMERALRMLERRRHLSVDTSEISRANANIAALRNRMNTLKGGGSSSRPAMAGGGDAPSGGGSMMGGLGSIVKGGLIVGAVAQVAGFVKDQVIDSYKTGLKNSSLKSAINSTTGGMGSQAVSMTSSIADKYGLNYEASLEGVKTLTGGLKSMNMPLAKQMEIFEGVSTGIAAMKLGGEESKGAMLALGQMASKGTVSAEELRGQLGERIPGAFGIAARAMNMTEAQLGKMMAKGEIAAKDFLPKFAAEMQKTFGPDAMAAAKGPQAIQERFNNAIYKMKAGIGEGLMPVITPVIEKFTTLATQVMPYIQQGIDWLVTTVSELSNSTGGWSDYVGIVKGYFMSIWPTVKSIAGSVFNIVKGILDWIGKSQILKDVFSALTWMMQGMWKYLGWVADKISWLWDNVLKPILDALETAYGWVKDLVGSKTSVDINHNATGVWNPFGTPAQAAASGPLVTTSLYQKPKQSVFGSGGGDVSGLSSKEATHSGAKQIIVNINKEMIGKIQFITQNGKEAAMDLENMTREVMNRVLYSLEGA